MIKKAIYILGCVFTCFLVQNVDAASNNISLNLDCPDAVYVQNSITCRVYATVTGNSVTLNDINVKSGDLITSVNSNIHDGTKLAVGRNIKLGTITAKAKSSAGEDYISLSLDAVFSDGEPLYKYNVKGTAEIKINRVISTVNTLNSISVDGVVIPNFNKNTSKYSISTSKSSISLTASKTDKMSTVTGTGNKSLKCGSNSFVISVKAENGNIRKYTVLINRVCNESSDLNDIIISGGVLSPSFSANIYNYTVQLDDKTENVSIKGVKSNPTQKIVGEVTNKKIGYGKTKISLVVTSQTGKTSTYSITFDKKDNRDDNNLLSSLSLSSGNIVFDPNTFEYEIKVLNDITKIEVLAVPAKETSSVKITGNDNLKVGNNVIKIDVKSEKGTIKSYLIKVNRLKEGETLGNNANIKSLSVEGYSLPFDYNKTDYKLVINQEKKLNIIVVMDDPTATYEIKGNENLKDGSIIEIITKSQDGSSKTYKIEITKPNHSIYFVIFGLLIATAIAIPLIVYFRSVKTKKEVLDVNGYKVGKDYAEDDHFRKTINNSSEDKNKINANLDNKSEVVAIPSVNNEQEKVASNPLTNQENVVGNEKVENKPLANQKNVIGKEKTASKSSTNQKNIVGKGKVNNQNKTDEENFDAGLQDYVPNESVNKCPACGRELLGTLNECPYCKTKLK